MIVERVGRRRERKTCQNRNRKRGAWFASGREGKVKSGIKLQKGIRHSIQEGALLQYHYRRKRLDMKRKNFAGGGSLLGGGDLAPSFLKKKYVIGAPVGEKKVPSGGQ